MAENKNISSKTNDKLANGASSFYINNGIGSSYKPYPKVRRNTSETETSLNVNSSNSYIVLGKDRSASVFSGEGGAGSDNCDAIDIVAGPLNKELKLQDSSDNNILSFNPNFAKDASRIYITQNGNIDDYFGLRDGLELDNNNKTKKFASSRGKSAIALKSDHIRIISRELIKLVSSGTDDTDNNGGVCLIAQNDEDSLEPMVLGNKLVNYLDEKLIKVLTEVIQLIYEFMNEQVEFNSQVMIHNHVSPFFGIVVPPSISLASRGGKNQLNHLKTIINSIKTSSNNEIGNKIPLFPVSKDYILSNYHKLN